MPFWASHIVARLQVADRLFQRRGEAGRIAGRLRRGDSPPTSSNKACTARPPFCGQLAADEVHRLHAVGAFVDLRDAGVADELLHALFADVAVAAEAPAAR